MTNEQIIADIATSVYGEDAVRGMIEKGIELPIHTVAGWKARGPYKIKKGEHGIETRLWKLRKNKGGKIKVNEDNGKDAEQIDMNRNFYLTKAFLFRADQVELITEKRFIPRSA